MKIRNLQPPGIGPQPGGAAGVGTVPMMPIEMMEKAELKAPARKTNLLGYACEKFELKQRGEVMEIWATDKLLPFQPWLANHPPPFGLRSLDEHCGGLLKAKKVFLLLAMPKFEDGPGCLRFEVKYPPKRKRSKTVTALYSNRRPIAM